MAAACFPLTEDQLTCSICRDVFTDPVSTPCGHNFCKLCVTENWSIDVPFECPLCKTMFYPKPELQVNTLVSDVVHEFRRSARINNRAEPQAAQPARDPHHVYTGSTWKVLVFCLLWVCVCSVFIQMKLALSLNKGSEGKKAEQVTPQDKIQQMIQEIQLRMEETKRSLELSEEDADREIAALHHFTEMMKKEMPKLLLKAELKRLQQYAVDVKLDPDTAGPRLSLSDDRKQAHCGDVWKTLPDIPERFDATCVVGKQSFSSGRFYFEVQVKGKTSWALGVARESVNRKGRIIPSPQNGFWTIQLRGGNDYKALAGPPIVLSLQGGPEKVGVFVDYEEGLVSFYDADTAALIYSFTDCSFTERLYPYLGPCATDRGENFAPLIITPVRHTD